MKYIIEDWLTEEIIKVFRVKKKEMNGLRTIVHGLVMDALSRTQKQKFQFMNQNNKTDILGGKHHGL